MRGVRHSPQNSRVTPSARSLGRNSLSVPFTYVNPDMGMPTTRFGCPPEMYSLAAMRLPAEDRVGPGLVAHRAAIGPPLQIRHRLGCRGRRIRARGPRVRPPTAFQHALEPFFALVNISPSGMSSGSSEQPGNGQEPLD